MFAVFFFFFGGCFFKDLISCDLFKSFVEAGLEVNHHSNDNIPLSAFDIESRFSDSNA